MTSSTASLDDDTPHAVHDGHHASRLPNHPHGLLRYDGASRRLPSLSALSDISDISSDVLSSDSSACSVPDIIEYSRRRPFRTKFHSSHVPAAPASIIADDGAAGGTMPTPPVVPIPDIRANIGAWVRAVPRDPDELSATSEDAEYSDESGPELEILDCDEDVGNWITMVVPDWEEHEREYGPDAVQTGRHAGVSIFARVISDEEMAAHARAGAAAGDWPVGAAMEPYNTERDAGESDDVDELVETFAKTSFLLELGDDGWTRRDS